MRIEPRITLIIKFLISLYVIGVSLAGEPGESDKIRSHISDKLLNIKNANKTRCFYGSTIFGARKIEFNIFPELRFFRIREISAANNISWLIVSIHPRLEKLITEDHGSHKLTNSLKQVVMAVGSGLIKEDIGEEAITLQEINSFRMLSYKIENSLSEKIDSKILFDTDYVEGEIYYLSDRWHEL
jgi:hypothetical protein